MAIENDRKSIKKLGDLLILKVPYSADLGFPFDKALKLAKRILPRKPELIKGLKNVKNARELEDLLADTDSTLIVEKNFAEDFNKFLDIESVTSSEVDKGLDNICPILPPDFIEEDLEGALSCEVPVEETKPEVDLDALEEEINKEDEVLAAKNKLENCISEIESITEKIKDFIGLDEKAIEIEFELEEADWFYEILIHYYEEREKEVKKFLGIFEPLIRGKRRLETEIEEKEQSLYTFSYGYGSTTTYTRTDNSAPLQLGHILLGKEKHPKKIKREKDLVKIKGEIQSERDKVFIFQAGLSEAELVGELEDLFTINNPSAKIKGKVGNFASENRIEIDPVFSSSSTNFDINFNFGLISPIFNAYRKGTTKLDYSIFRRGDTLAGEFESNIIEMFSLNNKVGFLDKNAKGIIDPRGILYDSLYNIMGLPNKFFSDEERGSTSTDLPVIINEKVFNEFWINYIVNWENKKDFVIETKVRPAHEAILQELRSLAKLEAQYRLAFGGVWSVILGDKDDEGIRLQDIVSRVEKDFAEVNKLHGAQDNALKLIKLYRKRINERIEENKNAYQNVPCAKNPGGPAIKQKAAGGDPLGKKTYTSGNDPFFPDPTKFCYWVEFSKLATLINVLPMPNNNPVPPNIFRYWPVGFIIPSPAGPINVPLPIIWLPLATIPTPLGIFVIFIGQCGILPCPFVLWNSPDGKHEFIATLRGKKKIESITKVSSSTLPTVKLALGSLKLTQKAINDVDVEGFEPIENPDDEKSSFGDVVDRVRKKVSKLSNPDFSKISEMRNREVEKERREKNGLSKITDFSLDEKLQVIEDSILGLFDKLDIGDICFPKDSEKLNPKKGIVGTILDTTKKSIDLNLPEITIPAAGTIDLKQKLFKVFEGNKELNEKVNLDGLNKEEKNAKVREVKDKMKKINTAGAEALKDPAALGIVASVAIGATVNFFNPFVCAPTGDGAKIPPLPGLVFAGIGTIATAVPAGIELLTEGDINGKKIGDILKGSINRIIPSLLVPDPSNLSIKDFAVDTSSKLALFDKPKTPNPGGLKPKICVPGNLIKATLLVSISAAIQGGAIRKIMTSDLTDEEDIKRIIEECTEICKEKAREGILPISAGGPGTRGSIPVSSNKPLKMRDLNPSDIRRLLKDLVENSLADLEKVLKPVLLSIAILEALPELDFFKLPIVEINKGFTLDVEEKKLDIALDTLAGLSVIPFFAVALGAEGSRALHPLANQDNLPPWERLTLKNPLFVIFLDQFCQTAKKGGGFKEGTNFPLPG